MKKILFILTVMTLCIGIVFASARLFAQGQLKNKVTANIITTRNTLSDTGNLGANFTSYIYNIYDVAGSNAEGGIRVKTMINRKDSRGKWEDKGYKYIIVYPKKSTTDKITLAMNDNVVAETKISWQDWTGNTSFYGTFEAYSN